MSKTVPGERNLGRRCRHQIVSLALVSMPFFYSSAISTNPTLGSEPAPSVQHPEVHPVWRTRDPHLVREVRPTYPDMALHQGIKKGMVIVQVVIDSRGRVKRPQVMRCTPSGHGFEEAAVKTVKKWLYEPAEINGRPVDVYYTVKVTFDHERTDPRGRMNPLAGGGLAADWRLRSASAGHTGPCLGVSAERS